MPNYYNAYGVISDARAVLDLLENFVEQALQGETNDEESEADETAGGGLYL